MFSFYLPYMCYTLQSQHTVLNHLSFDFIGNKIYQDVQMRKQKKTEWILVRIWKLVILLFSLETYGKRKEKKEENVL